MLKNYDNIRSDYLTACFADLPGKIKSVVAKLTPHADRFEGIVVRGTSGLLVGPMVAATMDKPWCVVRKENDGTHSSDKVVEGWTGFKTYVVIDDLIATGTTLKIIQRQVRDEAKRKGYEVPSMVGFYLYNLDELRWRGDGTNYHYYDRYFLFPEITEKPNVAEQIAAAAAARPGQASLDF